MARLNEKTKLTSVKLLTNIYRNFKMIALQQGISLQEVVNRSILLYETDTEFRNKIDSTTELEISGSF